MEINSRIGSRKAQSAMEYLMTYGWAILIIVVVLAAIAEMGLFNPSTYAQSICDLPANLFCKSFSLTTSGVLTVTIENTMQDPINITAVGCGNQSLANMQSITPVYLPQGHSYTFNVQCEGAANSHIGQLYTGYITLNYTDDVTLFSQTVSGKVIVKTLETSTTSTTSTSTTLATTSTTSTTSTSTTSTTSTSTTSTTSTSTTTILYYYVPITLSNSQSSATPSPFQQMITVNSLAYEQYEAGGLTNVAFYNASGTQLDSWLESGNSNTSTNTVYWVKLPNGIPASSSITIYMRFYQPLSNTQFNSNNDGEAPQLSSTYGQYDDGASVFNAYLNFEGTSLPSGWNSGASSDGTVSINNGLTLGTGTSDNPSYAYIVSTTTYTPQIVEFYLSNIPTSPGGVGGVSTDWGFSSNANPTPQGGGTGNNFGYLIGGAVWSGAGSYAYQLWDDNTKEASVGGTLNTGIYGTYINPLAFYYNYAVETSATTAITSSNYLLLGLSSAGSSAGSPASETIQVDWLRTRAYPPNGAMPSVGFGSLSHN